MDEENWKLEDNVNDWVKENFRRLKQGKFTVESSMSNFLKTAIQEGVELKRLELEEKGEKEKSKSWKPDFELECFEVPVLIENKLGLSRLSCKNKEKLKQDIKSAKNYAVNGAIHYAQCAILSKKYKDVIAIGIAGDNRKNVQIEVYYVYGSTDETYKIMKNYTTLDFLENEETFREFYKEAILTEEEKQRILIDSREKLQRYAKELNKLMHNHSITAPQRVLYVSGMLLAMQDLIVNGKVEKRGLIPEDLQGVNLKNQRDGDIIVNHIRNYLELKDIEDENLELMMASFKEINKDSDRDKPINLDNKVSSLIKKEKASVNKQIFTYIYENIFKSIDSMSGHIDIMGEMYSEFLKYALGDGKEIGIILTPPYVTKMMAEILELDTDSKVMDLATGSAGFLISAIEIMINKAETEYGKNTTRAKEIIKDIKSKQILGVELNAEMFTLASTNMILRGYESSNIKKGSCFDKTIESYEEFKADRLLLNPPFTYNENGMPFIEFGLRNIKKGGKAAIIIQDSAGSGQAISSCKEILSYNQMIASIKMPADLFLPMAGVQTSIYVFEHTEKEHDITKQVRFIDFRNDGYKRTKRNVSEIDNPKQRYQDIIEIYKNGITANVDKKLWNLEEQVVMDRITLEGNDWNFEKHKKINKIPTQEDFKRTVKDYLDWKISDLTEEDDLLGK